MKYSFCRLSYKSIIAVAAAAGVAALPLMAHALERTAVGDKNAQSVNAFSMQMEATKAAVAAAMNDALARIALLEGRVDDLELTTENLDSRLTTAESEITSLKDRVTSLESRMATAESDIATLKAQVANLLLRVANLESYVTWLNNRVSSLESEMATTKNRVSALEWEMANAKNRISALESEVNSLKTRVSALESRVAALEGTGLPSAMIAAFHAYSCPTGWSPATWLNGRTIVGTGGSYGYVVGSAAGADFVALTAAQLPQHSHGYTKGNEFRRIDNDNESWAWVGETTEQAYCSDCGGQAFDNRMPFYAELYCYKN